MEQLSTSTPTSCRRGASRITARPRQEPGRTRIASRPRTPALSARLGRTARGHYRQGQGQYVRRHKPLRFVPQPDRQAGAEGLPPCVDQTASSSQGRTLLRYLLSTASSADRAAGSVLVDQDPPRQLQLLWRSAEAALLSHKRRSSTIRTAGPRHLSPRSRRGHRRPCRPTRPGMGATTRPAAIPPSTPPQTRARYTPLSRTRRRRGHRPQ